MSLNKILILFVFLLPFSLWSQTIIEGVITGEKNLPVDGASIMVKQSDKTKIITYAISDKNGKYQLSFSSPSKKVIIKVSRMGYRMIEDTLNNLSQERNYRLQKHNFRLKEVIVKIPPVTKKGDTIRYNVTSFASGKDRSIADVLKKMPGINVLPDGKILYQGKPINKYYINGLDLLCGRYNLANDNLPYKEVARVEIFENHQPIKILDSLVYSEQAALNIKLKRKYTFTGQIWAGAGFVPLLREVNLTPMLFTRGRQVLFSYQTNNTGKDLTRQLNVLAPEDLLLLVENQNANKNQLNIVSPVSPGFSKKRWLDNDSHLLSFHFLQKTGKESEIKMNLSYLYNNIQEGAVIKTRFFTAESEWVIQEELSNRFYNNTFQTEMVFNKNSKNLYFKNVLKLRNDWNKLYGVIDKNDGDFYQKADYNMLSVSNRFYSIFSIGKQLFSIRSSVILSRKPEMLLVTPGVFPEALNNGEAYMQSNQYLKTNRFFTNNYIGLTRSLGTLVLSMKTGFIIKRNLFNSSLLIDENQQVEDAFVNNNEENRNEIYTDFSIQYQKNRWKMSVFGKFNLSGYDFLNSIDKSRQKKHNFFVSPGISLRYNWPKYWKSATVFSRRSQWDDLAHSFQGYILQNYSSLIKMNIPLSDVIFQNFSQEFSYRNPLRSLFMNVSYTYQVSNNQYLYQMNISSRGTLLFQAVEYSHIKKSHSFEGGISKYFPGWKTGIDFKMNGSYSKYPQLINDKVENSNNLLAQYSAKVHTNITKQIAFSYKPEFVFYKSRISNKELPALSTYSHFMEFSSNFLANQWIGIDTEYRKNKGFTGNQSAFFADIIYRFSLPKKKWDFEIQWRNITNRKLYTNMVYSAFSYKETTIDLRPSQILFKVRFSL